MLFLFIGGLFLVLGAMYIVNATKPTFDITKIKGKQKSGETDEQYIQRLRKKSLISGIFMVIFGVFCIGFALFFPYPA
ncbi:hypothetical protein [Clostridium ganghwense]|uniref:DUF3784 domain-containing protein n=1 Tax=Clostridium ganghwense TaxID=312089 RepID=A0ABT4CPF5_9CLOT|nr:hypothetical protein [Clostridium ganghwense]MCY6369961.1 hypothetical protein [Clostridium ganghwense]